MCLVFLRNLYHFIFGITFKHLNNCLLLFWFGKYVIPDLKKKYTTNLRTELFTFNFK